MLELDDEILIEANAVAELERERIIKLLKEHAHPEAEAEYLIDCDLCERYCGVGIAIALIKGNNK